MGNRDFTRSGTFGFVLCGCVQLRSLGTPNLEFQGSLRCRHHRIATQNQRTEMRLNADRRDFNRLCIPFQGFGIRFENKVAGILKSLLACRISAVKFCEFEYGPGFRS